MPKFLTLLDPRGVVAVPPGLTIGEQAIKARTEFPRLVEMSRLRYWRLGNHIPEVGSRLLLGVSPTFSMPDMRLLDLVNQSLSEQSGHSLCVEVFDLDDSQRGALLPIYFPGLTGIPPTPIAGIWCNGRLERVHFGDDAIAETLLFARIPVQVEDLKRSVRPPTSAILDD